MAQLSINWKDKRLLLIIILLLGAFLRLNRLSEHLDFNGDLGRDALVAKRILVDHKLTLIGPRASGGDFYLGPFYYYLIAPTFLLSGFSPLGPVYLMIIFSILTVVLVYFLGSRFFNQNTGLLASFLYATSPLVIKYSRLSGNYVSLPFFSLLAIYFFWLWLKKRTSFFLVALATTLGLAVQLHYSSVVLIFFFFLVLLVKKINPFKFGKQFLLAGLAFFLLCSPLLFFDLRHNWVNSRGLIGYLTKSSGEDIRQVVGVPAWSFEESFIFFGQTLVKAVSPFLTKFWYLVMAILVFIVIRLGVIKKGLKPELTYLLSFLIFGWFFSCFYKGYLADYYLIFLFPVPILIVAYLFCLPSTKFLRILILGLVIILITFNATAYFKLIESENPRKLKEITLVAKTIADDVSGGENFNLFLKRETPFWSTASEYRYLVEIEGPRALGTTEYNKAKYLYFIDETKKADPLEAANWEVAEFGPKKIIKSWTFPLAFVYKLEN